MLPALLALLALAAASPAPAPPPPATGAAPEGRWLPPTELTGRCAGHSPSGRGRVSVYLPAGDPGPAGWPLAIALHGWRHTAAHWAPLGIGALADRYGVAVVLPETTTSVFERAWYPETRRAWGRLPGACWIGEVVLPWARRTLPVSPERRRTAILGYSTGGRGALMVAGRYPEFAFAGSLSGTFDLGLLRPGDGEYAIHEEVFGSRATHPGRWSGEEVDPGLPALAGTALFAAHGGADAVVRPDQLAALARRLPADGPPAVLVEVAGAGHDEQFWRLELPALFAALASALDLPPAPAPR